MQQFQLHLRYINQIIINQKNQSKMQNLINYTNNRLAIWYANVQREYGVIGSGSARFENDKVIISYTEDGVGKTWSMAFHPEYLKQQSIDWVFNCWAEQAN